MDGLPLVPKPPSVVGVEAKVRAEEVARAVYHSDGSWYWAAVGTEQEERARDRRVVEDKVVFQAGLGVIVVQAGMLVGHRELPVLTTFARRAGAHQACLVSWRLFVVRSLSSQ